MVSKVLSVSKVLKETMVKLVNKVSKEKLEIRVLKVTLV